MRAAFLLVCPLVLCANTIVLYNGTTGLPASPWEDWDDSASETHLGTFTRFDSTAGNSIRDGYARLDVPLDLNTGFWLRFSLRLDVETHASPNRAGLSIIATGNNAQSVEISFWEDQIWAQSASFTKAESAAFNPTNGFVDYSLHVKDNGYSFYASNSLLLQGNLRSYPNLVYQIPNFLFIGDNTTSASGRFDLGRVEFEAVPEPAYGLAVGLGLLAVGIFRRQLHLRS